MALSAVLLLTAAPQKAYAQFREDAFQQNYSSDASSKKDTTDYNKISFKNVYGGLTGKHELSVGNMLFGNLFLPGSAQIYNKQAWKLGVFYPVIAGAAAGGVYCNMNGHQDVAPYLFAGAAATYWAMQLDATINYNKHMGTFPGRTTVYAALVPGLGQAINGEYWKIPLYHGIIITSYSLFLNNRANYERFRRIYIESQEPGYTGQISGQTALYYRNTYRRMRDYCVIGMIAGYLIQIIDANVFAFMGDFEMSDDLTFQISPSIIPQQNNTRGNSFAPGMSLAIKF